jgi:hypothetical protein
VAANAQPAPEAPKGRRLTPEESARMDQRIRKLSHQHKTGTEIRDTLNGEFGVSSSREAYYKRVRGMGLQWFKLPVDRPKCSRAGCPRLGKTMAVYYTFPAGFSDRPAELRTVRAYTCRPQKPAEPHHCYIWLETGESVSRTDRGKFEFLDGAISTDGLSLRWRHDEAFRESQRAVIQEMVKRDDVREKRRAAGKRRHEANPTFMRTIAKIHLEDPEENAKWLKGLRHGVKTPEARANMREGQKRSLAVPGFLEQRNAAIKVGQAKRNARTLPADLKEQPELYRMLVPVLVAARQISNSQLRAMFRITTTDRTITRIRAYCGVPGPKGRPTKNL